MSSSATCVGCKKHLRVADDITVCDTWLCIDVKLSVGVCVNCPSDVDDWDFHRTLAEVINRLDNGESVKNIRNKTAREYHA